MLGIKCKLCCEKKENILSVTSELLNRNISDVIANIAGIDKQQIIPKACICQDCAVNIIQCESFINKVKRHLYKTTKNKNVKTLNCNVDGEKSENLNHTTSLVKQFQKNGLLSSTKIECDNESGIKLVKEKKSVNDSVSSDEKSSKDSLQVKGRLNGTIKTPLGTKKITSSIAKMKNIRKCLAIITCNHCSIVIPTLKAIKPHMTTNHPTERIVTNFKCPECPRSFRRYGILKQHVIKTHYNNSDYDDKAFSDDDDHDVTVNNNDDGNSVAKDDNDDGDAVDVAGNAGVNVDESNKVTGAFKKTKDDLLKSPKKKSIVNGFQKFKDEEATKPTAATGKKAKSKISQDCKDSIANVTKIHADVNVKTNSNIVTKPVDKKNKLVKKENDELLLSSLLNESSLFDTTLNSTSLLDENNSNLDMETKSDDDDSDTKLKKKRGNKTDDMPKTTSKPSPDVLKVNKTSGKNKKPKLNGHKETETIIKDDKVDNTGKISKNKIPQQRETSVKRKTIDDDCNENERNVANKSGQIKSDDKRQRLDDSFTEKIKYKCSGCHKEYSNKEKMHLHVLKHHHQQDHTSNLSLKTENESKETSQSIQQQQQQQFNCNFCGKDFETKKKLKQHTKNVHNPNASSFNMDCPNCGKEFHDREKYNNHYFSEACIDCIINCQFPNCNKRFAQTSAMRAHMRKKHCLMDDVVVQ